MKTQILKIEYEIQIVVRLITEVYKKLPNAKALTWIEQVSVFLQRWGLNNLWIQIAESTGLRKAEPLNHEDLISEPNIEQLVAMIPLFIDWLFGEELNLMGRLHTQSDLNAFDHIKLLLSGQCTNPEQWFDAFRVTKGIIKDKRGKDPPAEAALNVAAYASMVLCLQDDPVLKGKGDLNFYIALLVEVIVIYIIENNIVKQGEPPPSIKVVSDDKALKQAGYAILADKLLELANAAFFKILIDTQ